MFNPLRKLGNKTALGIFFVVLFGLGLCVAGIAKAEMKGPFFPSPGLTCFTYDTQEEILLRYHRGIDAIANDPNGEIIVNDVYEDGSERSHFYILNKKEKMVTRHIWEDGTWCQSVIPYKSSKKVYKRT